MNDVLSFMNPYCKKEQQIRTAMVASVLLMGAVGQGRMSLRMRGGRGGEKSGFGSDMVSADEEQSQNATQEDTNLTEDCSHEHTCKKV